MLVKNLKYIQNHLKNTLKIMKYIMDLNGKLFNY